MNTYTHINRALDWIEDRLLDRIDIRDLANAAYMSEFHFQRTFKALTGHSPMRYIRRRRLSWAVEQLKTDTRIIEIALDCQFESQEAFTRAFKSQFHTTPGQCRKEGIEITHLQPRLAITPEYIEHLFGGMTMEPVLKSLENYTLVGMNAAFIPEQTNMTVIPRLWGLFCARLDEVQHIKPGPMIGLVNCLPALEGNSNQEKPELVYMAAAPVEKLDHLPDGFWATSVPAADYAVFRTSVKGDTINKVIDYAYGEWLPKSGYTRGDGPELEFYAEDFDPDTNPEFDYAIPIQK